MGGRTHEESNYRELEYSPEKCYQLGLRAIKDDNELWLIAEEDEPAGMLGAWCRPPIFSKECVASDHLVYVSPRYRGSSAFIKLVRAYVRWAKKRAKLIFLATSTGYETEKLYTRLGFIKRGGIYQLR